MYHRDTGQEGPYDERIKVTQPAYYNLYKTENPYEGNIPIPPPPPTNKRSRMPFFFYIIIAILLVFVAVGSYILAKINSTPTIPQVASPTTTPTVVISPNPTPTQNIAIALGSSDFQTFLKAFATAMSSKEYADIH